MQLSRLLSLFLFWKLKLCDSSFLGFGIINVAIG